MKQKKRQPNLQIRLSEIELHWVQIILKRAVTETITMNILNKLEISKNLCANYVSRNQMCKPKPQVARKRRQMA